MKKKFNSINFSQIRNSTLAKNVILATFFTLIILLGSTSLLQADIIHVGGWINSNETWLGGNTYILDSDVNVAEGVQLTILPGCTIHLNHYLRIYGLLHACGDESNWINFGGSGGTMILVWSSSATLGFCDFYSGGYGAWIHTDGSVTFNDCVFNNNTNGVLIQNSPNLSFTDCNFNFNTSNGVELENYEHGFSTVAFTNCNVKFNGGAGFNLYGVSQNSATTVMIDNSNIESNGDAGFHSSAVADIYITGTVISENEGDGISVSGNGVYVSGDILLENVGISENGGRGLYLPVLNTALTILGYLDIYTNGLVAIEVHANMVGNIPDDSILGMGDNNPDGIHVIGSNITQNATWLKRDNHYTILGDIIIEDTATLQLSTNSDLIFCDYAGIEINGAILADSVNFKPVLWESWKGIYFKNNIPGSVLNACTILSAGYPFDPPFAEAAGIIIYEGDVDSTVTMTNCNITNSFGHGIYINRGASPYIDNCTIEDCSRNGIYISWSSNPIITNSTITSGDSCGIYINYSSNPYIDNCVISDNENYGVFTNQGSNGGTLKNGSIQNNIGPAVRLPANMVRDISTINISGNGRNQRLEVAGGNISDDAVWGGDYDYIIYDDLFLDYGHLTLEAGSVLKFENDVNMDIRTSLMAIGTPDNHIVFTSNQTVPAPGDWDKLYFDYSDQPSNLQYCDILYGGSDGYGSVVLWEHIASFDYCDISHSSSSGMCFWGDATAYITNSEIHHNATFGVESNPWNSIAEISNTIIHDNGDYAIQAGADEIQFIDDDVVINDNEKNAIKVIGDDVVTGTWYNHDVPYDIEGDIHVLNNETLTIEAGNKIHFLGNYSINVEGALLAESTADERIVFTNSPDARTNWKNISFSTPDDVCQLTLCDFTDGGNNAEAMLELDNAGNLIQMDNCNICRSSTYGLYCFNNSSPQLINCYIDYNDASGVQLDTNSSPQFIKCVFKDNAFYGIDIDGGGCIPTFGNSLEEWNVIFGNEEHSIYNGTSDIDAKYIYWGTTDTTEINAAIFDKNDDGTLGLVNYSPWTNAAHDTLYYSSYGSISGTVILADGAGNITEVEVTAGGMIVNPDTNGDYIIEGLPPITYDVQASLINYADSTVIGVIVVGNQNTPDIDFTLYSAAPVADFSAEPTFGNQPLEVQFTDLSINGPSSWLWDFGDGNTSAAQNPLHEFIDWGTFTVSLTATNDNGSDTEIKVDYIIVNGQPVADAGPDQTVDELTPVQLDGSGSYDPEGETLTYSWTTPPEIQLSDSTAMQPTFTAPYVTDSTEFSIELIVFDGEWYSDPSIVIITVLDIIGIDEKPIPENYTLFGSYPNPFKGSVEIKFGLPQHAFVEIKIYDIRGRLVTTLSDEQFDAGNHTLTWDGNKQKSGLYFYKMIVDGKPYDIKKMIILR